MDSMESLRAALNSASLWLTERPSVSAREAGDHAVVGSQTGIGFFSAVAQKRRPDE